MSNLSDPTTVWRRRAEVQIIDVRLPDEFDEGSIPGAINVPLGDLVSGSSFEVATDRPVVLVCTSGEQSEIAAIVLHSRDFDAFNVTGGLRAWGEAGFPIESPDEDEASSDA